MWKRFFLRKKNCSGQLKMFCKQWFYVTKTLLIKPNDIFIICCTKQTSNVTAPLESILPGSVTIGAAMLNWTVDIKLKNVNPCFTQWSVSCLQIFRKDHRCSLLHCSIAVFSSAIHYRALSLTVLVTLHIEIHRWIQQTVLISPS